jgi:sulfoxide reductase heme-binding subunit YedZ
MRWLKTHWLLLITHGAALLPGVLLLWDYQTGGLSVNPVQDITLRTGKSGLVLLVLMLTVTPVNFILGWRQVIPLRKWLGLYAFMYVALHFYTFVWLDYRLDLQLLQEAIFEKRFALVGFAAFVILIPLAVTSTKGWMRRLGKRWKKLHRLVYAAALLAVVHYVWLVKSDVREPLVYGAVVVGLLALRLPAARRTIARLRSRFKRPAQAGLAAGRARGG